jgi:hypothetical protein
MHPEKIALTMSETPQDACAMPTRPLSALGNREYPLRCSHCLETACSCPKKLTFAFLAEYVTFQPEQQEIFIIKHKIWVNSSPFEVNSAILFLQQKLSQTRTMAPPSARRRVDIACLPALRSTKLAFPFARWRTAFSSFTL